jgi:hypothetical protein
MVKSAVSVNMNRVIWRHFTTSLDTLSTIQRLPAKLNLKVDVPLGVSGDKLALKHAMTP